MDMQTSGAGTLKAVDRATFDKAYDEFILGRSFVENKDYYRFTKRRYWRTYQQLMRLSLHGGMDILEVGGGQFAVLLKELHGLSASAGDVNDRPKADLEAAGMGFEIVDLYTGTIPDRRFDLVIILEVIEHIPLPPYVVMDNMAKILKPGGHLFLTTPNGTRMRNILYALAGKEVLDKYRIPEPGESLGHMHEYTLPQMQWQAARSELEPVFAEQQDCAWEGGTKGARLMRQALLPFNTVPHLRESLVMALKYGA